MASFNKIILIGNLTRDPQLSYLPNQTPVVEIGLAVNRKWKGSDGQPREEVCFIDCRAFGKQAETINQYLSKGKSVLIEGRLTFDQWESKDGVKRNKHRVAVERFTFLSAPGERNNQPAPAETPQQGPTGEEPQDEYPPF